MSETTLVKLPAGGGVFDESNLDAIQAMIAAQNLNNTSLRAGINACATTPVASSQLDPTTVQYATVNITLAQLQALYSAGLSVIAAQGAGTFTELLSAVLEYKYGSAAFTIGSATNLTLNYTNASGAAASVARAVTGVFDQTASQLCHIKPIATNIAGASSGLLNAALTLNLAVADMTGGTGGSAILKMAYRVHSGL